MKYTLFLFIVFVFSSHFSQAQEDAALIDHLIEFSKTSSVTGREEQAANYIQSLFQNGALKKDKLGNLVLTLGSGLPRRLITAPIDEPGYVISQIQDDGYLRVNPIGTRGLGNLYHQFLQGHEVNINTETGPIVGVSTVRSSHYERLRAQRESTKKPFQWQEAIIDLGSSSAAEITQKNIQLLDPVTLNKKPSIISNSMLVAPSMRTKAAAIALALVAKNSIDKKIDGTLVIAWTTLELLNGKGFETVINEYGPFNEIHRFNRFLEAETNNENRILSNADTNKKSNDFIAVKPTVSYSSPASTLNLEPKTIYEIGLAAQYINTPVELVAVSDVKNLIQYWSQLVGKQPKAVNLPQVQVSKALATYSSFNEEHSLLYELIGQYGVSLQEEKVRQLILNKLPKWAKPKVDSVGNISLTFGQGKDHLVFVAHMDETGYVVDAISDEGLLILKNRGGMLPWLWEAQPALIHVSNKPIQGVFTPRSDYRTGDARSLSSPLSVFAGFGSRSEALKAGIVIGSTTVTMPKEMIRLSENRATARGFDDRVGCAALLMSLAGLDPSQLQHKITFVWSVAEEIGLVGASYAATNLTDASYVYPIDTYVSSDDPYTDETFANCPLGNGAVIRVLESINFISRDNLKRVQKIADKNNILTQFGMTAGGTDGQAFLGYGIPSIPLSWPGRYSHSPVELMDYRDLSNLVALIQSIIEEDN